MERDSVATFDDLHGFRIERDLGYVSAAAVRQCSRMRATFRSLGMLIGLAPAELKTDVDELRADVLNDMRTRAAALGANAVIDVRFEASEGDGGEARIVVSGRAVILRPEQNLGA